MVKSLKILIPCVVLVCIVLALLFFPASQAEGTIKKCDVVEGTAYTLTVVGDNGKEYKVNFPGGQLRISERCKIHRSHLFAQWEFVEYLPSPSKP
jgi:hypothetical protein